MIDAVVVRRHVLYDEAPLARPLVVVDADTRVRRERIEANRQRMRVALPSPRHLQKALG